MNAILGYPMAYELIISEKPQAAKKIAEALADKKAKKESINKVPYYKLTHNKKEIVVGCAVGHLYTLTEKRPQNSLPNMLQY
jgi:DNA topoisomerase-1